MQRALERYGIHTEWLAWRSSAALWRLGARTPHAIVMDVPPPVTADHVEFLHRLRDRWERVPQIVVTWGATPSVLTSLLAVGVDDFVSSEDGWVELVVRLRRQLRRVSALTTPFAAGPDVMQLDAARRAVTASGRRVQLTNREFEVFRCLADRGGQVLTREQILELVWGNGQDRPSSPGIVGVYVLYLRRKLSKLGLAHALRTVKGEGYTFQAPGSYWAPGDPSALSGRRSGALDRDASVAAGDRDVHVAAQAEQDPHQAIRREAL